MEEQKGLKDRKNRIIIYLLLFVIIGFSFGFYYKIKLAELEYSGDCWLWVEDENGFGFGDIVTHCHQTKINCESDWHNVSCQWIEGRTLVDSNGNELGTTAKGCKCKII